MVRHIDVLLILIFKMEYSDIKFIRAVWGDYNQITNTPLLNEMVYVWGTDNYNHLKSKGFDCVLVSENKNHYNNLKKFQHKLDCLKLASETYERFIFLDWDVEIIKKIDVQFYKYFDDKELSVPTYSYPIEIFELHNEFNNGNPYDIEFFNTQIVELKKYNWVLNDNIIIPNAGFIYCGNKNIPTELIKISNDLNLITLIEEFSIFNYVNCDFEYYIKNYEPTVLFGRPLNDQFNISYVKKEPQIELHRKINRMMFKDIYLNHP